MKAETRCVCGAGLGWAWWVEMGCLAQNMDNQVGVRVAGNKKERH